MRHTTTTDLKRGKNTETTDVTKLDSEYPNRQEVTYVQD